MHFRSPFLERLPTKFGFDWPSGFRGEDILNSSGELKSQRPYSKHIEQRPR